MARGNETAIVVTTRDDTKFDAIRVKFKRIGDQMAKDSKQSTDAITRSMRKIDVDGGGGIDNLGKRLGFTGGKLKAVGALAAGAAATGIAAVGAAAVTAGAKVVEGFNTSVDAASNLGESLNAVGKVFGREANTIRKWGEQNAAAFGLSKRAFNELATPLGAGLKNAGLSLQDTSKWTIDLTKRASDMASVFNTDVSTALEAIQAGLRGEADPLEQFGVGLSAAKVEAKALAMSGKDVASSLTEQERMQARLALIMEQTNSVAGDFQSTSDGLANSQRIAAAETENLQAKIGDKLMPITLAATKAKLALAQAIGNHLVPVLDRLSTMFTKNIGPALQQLKDSFLKGAQQGFEVLKRAVSDNRPQLEWLAENLGQLAKDVFPIVIKGAEIFGRVLVGSIAGVVRTIGFMVDAFLFLKEQISGALAGGLQAFKVFSVGITAGIRNILESLRGYAKAADIVFHTNTSKALNSAIASFDRFNANAQRNLDGAIGKLHGWQREAASDRNLLRLKANKQDAEDKIADIKRRLRDPGLTRPQKIKLQADKTRAESTLRSLQKQIDRMRGKTIYLNVRERLGAGVRRLGRQDYASGGIVSARGMASGGIANAFNAMGEAAGKAIGHAAEGGPRSLTWTGEHGPELVELPAGSMVHSNPDSQRMASQMGGGGTVRLEIASSGNSFDQFLTDWFIKSVNVKSSMRVTIRRASAHEHR